MHTPSYVSKRASRASETHAPAASRYSHRRREWYVSIEGTNQGFLWTLSPTIVGRPGHVHDEGSHGLPSQTVYITAASGACLSRRAPSPADPPMSEAVRC